MKHPISGRMLTAVAIGSALICLSCTKPEPALKEVFKENFLIGTAMNVTQIMGKEAGTKEFVARNFNSLTAEDCMKWERIHPMPSEYVFTPVDSMIAFANRNGMFT